MDTGQSAVIGTGESQAAPTDTGASVSLAAPTDTGAQSEPEADESGYKTTVTVSTILEFVEAIGNDTHIILKAGEYNFSDLPPDGYDNPQIREPYFDPVYVIYGVSNLCIEAEEGAVVEIVTENYYAKPLEFWYCSGIMLKGLTCGHKVMTGTCTGSVIYAQRTCDLFIEDCHLYGCGTYGLEAYQCEKITVYGTEIYECSEGVAYLCDTYSTSFNSCRFHDNDVRSYLLDIRDGCDIVFEDTEFVGNDNPEAFLFCNDGTFEVYFRNCAFRDNTNEPVPNPQDDDVFFENCKIAAE